MLLMLLILFVISSWSSGMAAEYPRCPVRCSGCDCCDYTQSDSLTKLSLHLNCSVSSLGKIVQSSNISKDAPSYVRHSLTCLSAIPENICEFSGIRRLDLRSNNISQLTSVSCLSELIYLNLENNKIQILKTGIFDGLTKLRVLLLSHNLIRTIEPGVIHTGLNSMKHLYLDYNLITTADIFWILNITHKFCVFKLNNNLISDFVNNAHMKIEYTKIYGPGMVDFKNNSLEHLPRKAMVDIGIDNWKQIGIFLPWGFDLRDNPWSCDCKMYGLLSIVHNFLVIVPRDYISVKCYNPVHLRGMYAYNVPLKKLVCNVTSSCPTGCLCQDQPSLSRLVVNCTGAGLTELPKVLPKRDNIYLYFQNNSITVIDNVPYLTKVLYFDISDNDVSLITSVAIDNLVALKHLNLNNNKLTFLPENIQKLQLTDLQLIGNRLVCNCSTVWMSNWLANGHKTTVYSKINCTLPTKKRILIMDFDEDSLDCVDNSMSEKLVIVLSVMGFFLIFTIVVMIYFRHEILTTYYLKVSPMLHRVKEAKEYQNDIYISYNDDDVDDRIWIKDHLLQYFNNLKLKSYVSFRDGVGGETIVEAQMETIHNSQTVIAIISESYLQKQSAMFEFNEVYHHMVQNRNGKLLLIKKGEFRSSVIGNRYIKSLFRLNKHYLDDANLYTKLNKELQTNHSGGEKDDHGTSTDSVNLLRY